MMQAVSSASLSRTNDPFGVLAGAGKSLTELSTISPASDPIHRWVDTPEYRITDGTWAARMADLREYVQGYPASNGAMPAPSLFGFHNTWNMSIMCLDIDISTVPAAPAVGLVIGAQTLSTPARHAAVEMYQDSGVLYFRVKMSFTDPGWVSIEPPNIGSNPTIGIGINKTGFINRFFAVVDFSVGRWRVGSIGFIPD